MSASGSAGHRRFGIALAALLLASAGLRLPRLDSDPPLDAARDMSLTVDGSWYAAAAIDGASGREPGIGPSYDPPLLGGAYRLAFALFGPTRWAANLVSVLAALLAIAFTALAARGAAGEAAGLLAGGLLSLCYPFLVYSRAPGVYLPIAAAAAMLLWLVVRAELAARSGWRRWPFETAAAVLVAVGLVGLKPIFLLGGVALAAARVTDLRRLLVEPRLRRVTWAAGAIALLAGTWFALSTDWAVHQTNRLLDYLRAGGGLAAMPQRVLTLEARLGLVALAPALCGLAALGWLRRASGEEPTTTGAPGARFALWYVGAHLALLAPLGYSPLRYALPALPALAFIAGRGLAVPRGVDLRWRSSRPQTTRGWLARASIAFFCAWLVLQALLAAPGPSELPLAVLAAAALAVVGAAWALTTTTGSAPAAGASHTERIRPHGRLRAALAAAAVTTLVGVEVFRDGVALAASETSIARAGEEVGAILDARAHLTGSFAHVLTWETRQRRSYAPLLQYGRGRLRRTMEEGGFTHLAMEVNDANASIRQTFANDGAPLTLVHELVVRRQPVHIYRLPWAETIAPLTEFERGVEALRRDDVETARRRLEAARADQPSSSAVASALAAALLRQGELRRARELLDEAVDRNPYEISALRTLLSLALENRDLARALELARRVSALDPADAEAARLAGELAAALRT